MIDITDIIVGVIGVLGLILTGIVIPMLRQWIKSYAIAAVQAAEILIGAGNGEQKFEKAKDYIEAQCKAHGIKIDMDTIEVAIENAWKALGLDHEEKSEQTVGF